MILITNIALGALWWLLAAEIAAALAGWQGLVIGGRRWLVLSAPLLGGLSWLLTGNTSTDWLAWGISAPPGLLLFALLALLRQRERRPETILAPGERHGRRIVELAIPIEGGPMPALLVEPAGGCSRAVLIVHGAGNHKMFYAWPLLHGLSDAGFAACAIDVDGHGDNPRVLDLPHVLDNVAAGVDWLRERYASVAVLGISQGGCIGARAVAEGVAADALILLEAPITVEVTKAVIRREMLTLALPATWALHRDVGTLGIVQGWRTKPTRARIGTVELIRRLDLLDSVARISCPLLLCYGGSDAVVPRSQAHAVAAAAPPGTTFALVPRATHLSLSIDGRVIRLVRDWLHAALEPTTERAQPPVLFDE
ncbi:MAG TPA: alpha/beta fold hydrolase [Herpetosiphonaceae bacterium]